MSEKAAAGEGRRLRRLLPAETKRPPSPATGLVPGQSALRQSPASVACNACRERKSKCSGERPTCLRCVQRRIQCHYRTQLGETASQAVQRSHDALRDRAATYEEFFKLLKNLPNQEAQQLLQRLRDGTDITTILKHTRAGSLLLQLAVVPETRFRYEFPYRSEMPKDFIPNNPYLSSLIYEAGSLLPPTQSLEPSEYTTSRFAANGNPSSAEYQSLYLKPFHAAQVVDSRLSDVRPSLWTTVCDNDALMRDLLGAFFRCEYQFTAAFQKDYFLEDMATERKDFCSSLLVNVILGYSCVCYPGFLNRAEYWNPHTLQYRFLAEAKRIWELEATEARITTIQAGVLLNVFYNLCGLDEIGQAYRLHAIALAHELRLFDGSIHGGSDRIRNGKAFTAWALYSWEALVGFSFMIRPLLKKPPDVALPDPLEDAQWYGEIWVKYPLDQRPMPLFFGEVFRARCQFRVIMNEFCHTAYSNSSELGITLDKANALHSQLKNCIYYHNFLLSLYEPLLNIKANQEPSPQQIVADADRYLQTLIRLYYLRHGFEAMDLFIVIPLMLAAFKCVDAIDGQTPVDKLELLRSTLMLAAKGLCSQRRNHYLAEALFRVIKGRMRPQEVALLTETIDSDEDERGDRTAMMQAVRSHWPVSVVRKKEDLESHILKNLVENYAYSNVDDGFTAANDAQ